MKMRVDHEASSSRNCFQESNETMMDDQQADQRTLQQQCQEKERRWVEIMKIEEEEEDEQSE